MAVVSKVHPAASAGTVPGAPSRPAARGRGIRHLAAGVGFGFIAFGVWLLADPAAFYSTVPGVSATGPLNHHFVHDIGAAYAASGVALWLAARFPAAGLLLLAPAGIFAGLHAVAHVAEWLLFGPVSSGAFIAELAGVVVPAMLIGIIALAWPAAGRAAS